VGLGLALVSGCDYSPRGRVATVKGRAEQPNLPRVGPPGAALGSKGISARRSDEERKAILENSITLIQRAALQPGGENFAQAVRKLNQYFEGTDPAQYQLESAAREFLAAQLDPASINQLQSREFRNPDTRHIEDCMMYYRIANRVAGTGDELARVRRVFDWVMQQVQLVPTGSFGRSPLGPAFARPYDVLVRGMASEQDGTGWAERAWLFMALCRQLDIDAGLITYSKGNTVDALLSPKAQATPRAGQRPRIVWICAALIDDKAYLFDTRLGLEVPGPGGQGVATLEQALADPSVLERMNIPGLAPYSASRASLLSSPTKIGLLIDSSPGYFSPKMKLLQRELVGTDRAILFSDPARQRDHFVHVLGPRAGTVSLWEIPLQVEARLFNDSEYVRAIQDSLFWFQRELPLVYARVKQLRGEAELQQAIEEYVAFRLVKNVPLVTEKKATRKELQKTIPQNVQDGLNVYATYFLALSHLENNNIPSAERMFSQVLDMVPEPKPGEKHPYYYMLRWGANTNLARIQEAKHDDQAAIGYYTRYDPTPQYTANLLRARELVWRNPLRP
jgi:hypothetical protein